MSVTKARGRVTLVGAGPGDPDLLTVRACRELAAADLVLYDALVDPRVLDLAPRAQRFSVGKRAGRHSMGQETINALLVRHARAGKRVVRLKAGDPFVLGRGGEELLALAEAGVSCEVVPGVSSAIAGPAAFGIPVTHRSMASGFMVLSAVPDDTWREVLAAIAPGAITVVMMMALGAREAIARHLEAHGWPGDLPAAVVLGAHGPRAWAWTGALTELPDVVIPEAARDLPGLVVLGQVVRVAALAGRVGERELRRGTA